MEVGASGRRASTVCRQRARKPLLVRDAGAVERTEIPETSLDDEGLQLVLKRSAKTTCAAISMNLAGRFGKDYVPGRSWKALAEMLLRLLPPLVIADLGAGEGTLALMLAQRAAKVIAVDSSEKMVEYTAGIAERNGVENIEYRLGDLEELPLADGEADIALLHQSLHHAIHPERALAEAWRILKPGGRIVIMDLLKHNFEQARELYADVWLGFSQPRWRTCCAAPVSNAQIFLSFIAKKPRRILK